MRRPRLQRADRCCKCSAAGVLSERCCGRTRGPGGGRRRQAGLRRRQDPWERWYSSNYCQYNLRLFREFSLILISAYSIKIRRDRDRSLADSPLVQCQVEREHEVHSRVAGPRPRDTRLRHESSDINIQLSTMGAGVRHSTKIRTSSLDFWSRLSSAVVINTSVLVSIKENQL